MWFVANGAPDERKYPMTLSTDVYILDEVDPLEVFRFCQGLLTKYDEPRHMPPEQQKVRNQQDGEWTQLPAGETAPEGDRSYVGRDGITRVYAAMEGRPWSRDNEADQGLPAWLMSAYRPDGPLVAEDPGHDEYCSIPENPDYYDEDEPCDGGGHDRVCWMSVDFDTTYSYRDVRGWGCGDLHAAMVAELGAWLTAKNVRWEWRNEFTGDVHVGTDGLGELGARGAEAQDWMRTMVIPAIVTDMALGGGGTLDLAGVGAIEVPDLSGGAQ
jgi:hypothetical protein